MWQPSGTLPDLGIALGIGLLIGAERGWEERLGAEGSRIAGIRTFGLLGLLGGVTALLAQHYGAWLLGLVAVATTIPLAVSYYVEAVAAGDRSLTTVVAALLTLALGALAVIGLRFEAVAAAVVTALLLSLKLQIHEFLKRIGPAELYAALQLLVLFAIVLPLLPDAAYGPWGAINPRQAGWMVALIATVSFAGYGAVRVAGPQRGYLATGLLGGLVSSTAVVLQFSRLLREGRPAGPLVAGMLGACGVMWLRMIVVTAVINPVLAVRVAPPLAVMAVLVFAWTFRRERDAAPAATDGLALTNPLSLGPALGFGVLLIVISVLVAAAHDAFGNAGVLALAALSGVADVDAITMSLAHQAGPSLDLGLAAGALIVASLVNSAVKAGLAVAIAGRPAMARVALPLVSAAAAGVAGIFVWT